jgi:hypothetical protein
MADAGRALQILGALNLAQSQVRRLIRNHPDFYPLHTDRGRWKPFRRCASGRSIIRSR